MSQNENKNGEIREEELEEVVGGVSYHEERPKTYCKNCNLIMKPVDGKMVCPKCKATKYIVW